MIPRLPLVAGAIFGAAGLALILGLAGAPLAAVVAAGAVGLLAGAAAGQALDWLRVTAGRAARVEQQTATLGTRVQSARDDVRADVRRVGDDARARYRDQRTETARQREVTHKLIRDSRKVLTGQINEQTKTLRRSVDTQVALLEAFIQLQRLVPLPGPMPRPGTWAASEDLLLWLAGDVLDRRPRLVVDLGSGQSSVWMAAAMRAGGLTGRVVAVDHEASYAAATTDLGRRQGVSPWLEVIHAPLVEVTIAGRTGSWYDPAALADLEGIDLVSIDGPPGSGAEQARWPALPLLRDRLAPGARVVLDDMIRADEQAILADYVERFPGVTVDELPFEKGAVVLTVP